MRVCNETETAAEHHCYKDEETASRFQDNEELRFSLRSVWKYAPWVRNIYIVTNGQIPSWLNLQHPRIHIVPHTSIFSNLTHLPTFSSPAIEANFHRIPGLSEHFLYLNDDVMFGREIAPSDFYSYGNGQRVYFAWNAPDCAEGCGSAWVGDGFCDPACNVSECEFDLGDCANVSATPAAQGWSWGTQGSEGIGHCSSGCLDSWIGDRYCDRACRNPECGMDAGDCGIDLVYQNINGMQLTDSQVLIHSAADGNTVLETLEVPSIHIGATSLGHHLDYSSVKYFNLSTILKSNTILDTAYSNPSLIRVMTASPKNNILMVYFTPSAQSAGITIDTSPSSTPSISTISNEKHTTRSTRNTSESSGHSSNTTTTLKNDGKIFITFSSKSPSTNELTEYMFYIQLHNTAPRQTSAPPSVSTPNSVDSASPIEPSDSKSTSSGNSRSLLSFEGISSGLFKSKLRRVVGEDDTLVIARANPKLEEKTFRRVLKLGLTQAQIDAERHLIQRSGRDGLDYLRQLGSPWLPSVVDDVERRLSSENGMFRGGRRRLLDNYGDSLKYVNLLLNKAFHAESRKVPAHMPHYLQKSVIERMQRLWRREFELTSSHQTRSKQDMQYAFSYFWYYMRETIPYDFADVWERELDVDGNGVLDANELRTVAVRMTRSDAANPKPNPKEAYMNWNNWARTAMEEPPEEPTFLWLRECDQIWFDWMPSLANVPAPKAAVVQDSEVINEQVVQNAKAALLEKEASLEGGNGRVSPSPSASRTPQPAPLSYYERASDRLQYMFNVTIFPSEWNLTKEQLLNCSSAIGTVERHYSARLRNRFELGDPNEVAFVMVPTNRSSAVRSMDDIRYKAQKFVCLNDNINHTDPHAKDVVRALQEFYKALFPMPSPFELPHGQRNKFLHTDELIAARNHIKQKKTQLYLIVGIIVILLIIALKVFPKRNEGNRSNTAAGGARGRIFNNSPMRHPEPVILPSHDV